LKRAVEVVNWRRLRATRRLERRAMRGADIVGGLCGGVVVVVVDRGVNGVEQASDGVARSLALQESMTQPGRVPSD
jgi:hypothetical protein